MRSIHTYPLKEGKNQILLFTGSSFYKLNKISQTAKNEIVEVHFQGNDNGRLQEHTLYVGPKETAPENMILLGTVILNSVLYGAFITPKLN